MNAMRVTLGTLLTLVHVHLQLVTGASIAARSSVASSSTGADACAAFQFTSPGVVADATTTEFFNTGDRVNVSNLFSSINSTNIPAFCRTFQRMFL